MRFVMFRPRAEASAQARVGVLVGPREAGQVVALTHPAVVAALGIPPGSMPVSLLALIESGLPAWTDRLAPLRASTFAQTLRSQAPEAVSDLADLRLLAPIRRPGKVVGAAFNFTDALAERGTPHPPEPVVFVRSGSTVIGPDDAIVLPDGVGNVTYEAELAVVIGRRALAVDEHQAMTCVAGYTIHNDVSGSDLVKADGGNFVRGKNLPSSAPLGPWLATPDEIADPYAIGIRLDIDGRTLQDGSTATMLHRIARLISFVSRRMPLDPGDVIATGTPAGVAAMHSPPAWLAAGTTVTITLAGLGRLANPVVAGPAAAEFIR